MQFCCQIRFGRKKILNYAYVLKNGVGQHSIFLNFSTKLAESSFLCRFRVDFINVLVCAMCFFFNKQICTSSLCRSFECMNIVWVNIGVLTGWEKIKQRRIPSF